MEFEPQSAEIGVNRSTLNETSYSDGLDKSNSSNQKEQPNGGSNIFRSISSNKDGQLDGDIRSVNTNVSDEVSEMTNPTYMSIMSKHKEKERAGTPASESESSLDQSESGTPLIPAARVLDALHESNEEKTSNSNENSVTQHSQGGKSRSSGKGNHDDHRNIDGNMEDIFDSSWNPIQEEGVANADELFPQDPFNDPFFTPGATLPKPIMTKTFLYESKESEDGERSQVSHEQSTQKEERHMGNKNRSEADLTYNTHISAEKDLSVSASGSQVDLKSNDSKARGNDKSVHSKRTNISAHSSPSKTSKSKKERKAEREHDFDDYSQGLDGYSRGSRGSNRYQHEVDEDASQESKTYSHKKSYPRGNRGYDDNNSETASQGRDSYSEQRRIRSRSKNSRFTRRSRYDDEETSKGSDSYGGRSRKYSGKSVGPRVDYNEEYEQESLGGSRSDRESSFHGRRRIQKGEDFLGIDKESGVVTMRSSRRNTDSSSLLSPRSARRSTTGSQFEDKQSFYTASPVRTIGSRTARMNRPSRKKLQISPSRRKFRTPEVLMDSESPVSLFV